VCLGPSFDENAGLELEHSHNRARTPNEGDPDGGARSPPALWTSVPGNRAFRPSPGTRLLTIQRSTRARYVCCGQTRPHSANRWDSRLACADGTQAEERWFASPHWRGFRAQDSPGAGRRALHPRKDWSLPSLPADGGKAGVDLEGARLLESRTGLIGPLAGTSRGERGLSGSAALFPARPVSPLALYRRSYRWALAFIEMRQRARAFACQLDQRQKSRYCRISAAQYCPAAHRPGLRIGLRHSQDYLK